MAIQEYEIFHTERRTADDPVGGPLKLVVDATVEAVSGIGALREWALSQGFPERDLHFTGQTLMIVGHGGWQARRKR